MVIIELRLCSGFGWVRVNTLHCSSYGTLFWICDQKHTENIIMPLLLLNSACTALGPSVSHSASSE